MGFSGDGGPALTLCDATLGWGGIWNRNGVIVFSPARVGPIFRVAAAGGIPTAVTALDKSLGEGTHRNPWFLPDGRHFFYTALPASPADDDKIAINIP